MKRKTTTENTKINGYYISDVARGFMGERGEGKKMLRLMGLSVSDTPFSVAAFLQSYSAVWKDKNGEVAKISFHIRPNQIECSGSYLGKNKSMRLFREWGCYESSEMIARLESEAIGDLCMKCIYENLECDD